MSILNQTVYVGMSGGVDSSVTAALLKKQGYNVVGVFMKNWTKNLPGFDCPWKDDFQDAKRVAVQLGIDFKVFDFQKHYKQKVVDYMITEYQHGRTPNPDIMCNQEIKFKLFLDAAVEDGADLVATGHYAKTKNGQLFKAKDQNKDQTYFLYRVTSSALEKTLFPLGGYKKTEVRKLAEDFGLVTATKKESMGICFVGRVGIKEFLSQYVLTKPGKIIDQNNKVVGEHDGAIYYTIGQRRGLDVGGGMPYYVTGKDMKKNQVFVTNDITDENLWSKVINLTDVHWINQRPQSLKVDIRTRHRAPLISASISHMSDNNKLKVHLDSDIRALTPGQSTVIYQGQKVLGGGIIY